MKKSEWKVMSLSLEPGMMQALDEAAWKNRRVRSVAIREAIELWLRIAQAREGSAVSVEKIVERMIQLWNEEQESIQRELAKEGIGAPPPEWLLTHNKEEEERRRGLTIQAYSATNYSATKVKET